MTDNQKLVDYAKAELCKALDSVFDDECYSLALIGSRACAPDGFENADIDFVLYSGMAGGCFMELAAYDLDWKLLGSAYDEDEPDTRAHSVHAYSLEFEGRTYEVQVLYTSHKKYYKRVKMATHVCKQLGIRNKAMRVLVFHAIVNNEKKDLDHYIERVAEQERRKAKRNKES